MMANSIEQQITRRAYELWEQAGKPEGRDKDFYHQAQEELKVGFEPAPKILPG
jgi:hypothetical protein